MSTVFKVLVQTNLPVRCG